MVLLMTDQVRHLKREHFLLSALSGMGWKLKAAGMFHPSLHKVSKGE